MAYMEFPGVDYTEKDWDSSQAIEGGATDTCGVIGIFQKGPINKPTLCMTFDQVVEKFGSYMANANAMYQIRGFFLNAGGSAPLYVNRVVHYSDITDASTDTATQARVSANDRRASGAEPTLTFYDKYKGAIGNTYGYKVVDTHRVTTVSTDATTSGATAMIVKVVRDFVVGDWVKISNASNSSYAKIKAIDISNRTLTFASALTNVFAAGAKIETADFRLEIYRNNSIGTAVLEKAFDGCNMDPDSNYYVEALVNSSASGSSLVTVQDEQIEVDNVYEKLPAITANVVYLTGGSDGTDGITDADYIGDATSKTGLYAFDDIREMIHVWCAESNSMAVTRAGYNYWESKMTGMFFAYVPSGLNPEQAAEFRDQAGWNTSYGALYHNHGYVTDPIGVGDNPQKLIPLTGHILGAMSLNDDQNEYSYGSAPAGENMVLLDVNSLEFEVDEKNGGVMYGRNNRNVNPIVNLSGNGGIAVWGSRTQSNVAKWRQIHARRIFIYVETTVTQQTRWMTFKNKNDALYTRATRVINKFLRTVYGLRGTTDEEKFQVVCNEKINDPEDSYVIARIGLRIESVAEFIWFEFGHLPEGISLEEV